MVGIRVILGSGTSASEPGASQQGEASDHESPDVFLTVATRLEKRTRVPPSM